MADPTLQSARGSDAAPEGHGLAPDARDDDATARLVVLLRGINVGPNRRIAMASLRVMLDDLGFAEVRTHLTSGNVVLFTSRSADEVGRAVEEGIRERFGFDVDVVVRTAAELAEVVAANPLAEVAGDGSKHLVAFLSHAPEREALDELATEAVAPERFAARGRELYLWCPDGSRDSRLAKALADRPPAPVVTVRNWNTVTKVLAMIEAPR